MVLVDMKAVTHNAFATHTGAVKLTHTVVVGAEEAVAPAFLNLPSHFGCAALAAEKTELELVLVKREFNASYKCFQSNEDDFKESIHSFKHDILNKK